MTNQQPDIVPVILSGGSGTRLWPASRARQPKQLLPLLGSRSLIQQTVDRLDGVPDVTGPIVVTNEAHAVAIQRALATSHLGAATLILEPVGRNTAPAVAVAACEVIASHGAGLMLVLASDHAMADAEAFTDAVRQAARSAMDGNLVTFGITPTAPHTGFGYIRRGDPLPSGGFRVDEFREKPDLATAERYVASGSYSWNSGMFLLSAEDYLAELRTFRPDMARAAIEAHMRASRDGALVRLDPASFSTCEADSIDYAVMEHTSRAAVLPIDPGWSDVGSWSSLWEITAHDPDGNTLVGDVTSIDTHNSYIRSTDRLVVTAGIDDMVVVDTPDALLVTTMEAAQDVKQIVDELTADGRSEVDTDGTAFANWGVTVPLGNGVGYDVQLLRIDAGSRCSLPAATNLVRHLRPLNASATVTIGGVDDAIPRGRAFSPPMGEPIIISNDGEDILMVVAISVDTEMERGALDRALARRSDTWSW